jgi:hypothetical protein
VHTALCYAWRHVPDPDCLVYVTLMMAIAEATSPVGSVLGSIVTFVLYGLLPMAIVGYIMPPRKTPLESPARSRAASLGCCPRIPATTTKPTPTGTIEVPATTGIDLPLSLPRSSQRTPPP